MTATRKELRPDYIQDERRGCAGERGETKEACGQEHDGGTEGYGGILEVIISPGNVIGQVAAAFQ